MLFWELHEAVRKAKQAKMQNENIHISPPGIESATPRFQTWRPRLRGNTLT